MIPCIGQHVELFILFRIGGILPPDAGMRGQDATDTI